MMAIEFGGLEYRLVVARPAKWWRPATYYVETDYGSIGPMRFAQAEDIFSLFRRISAAPAWNNRKAAATAIGNRRA